MKLGAPLGTPSVPTDQATVTAGITEIVDKAIAATSADAGHRPQRAPTAPARRLRGRRRTGAADTRTSSSCCARISARGARPLLLISARPYIGGDALAGGSGQGG